MDTGFSQNTTDENKQVSDTRNVNRSGSESLSGDTTTHDDTINSRSGEKIDTSSHFDGATMLSAMQNGYKDENYSAIEQRFNEAKKIGNDSTDDNKAARFNLLKDTLYGFADVTNREETSDTGGWSNTTGVKGSIGSKIPLTETGGSIYTDNNKQSSTSSTESHSMDATWGKINEIYEQSGTAHEFLTEVNKFHDSQHETMTQMSSEGDLSQDNPTNQEQKQEQSDREQSAKEDEQRVRDYLSTKGGNWQ